MVGATLCVVDGINTAESFLESLRLHQPSECPDSQESLDAWLDGYDSGVIGAAARVLVRQEGERLLGHLGMLAEGNEPGLNEFVERESNISLLIALLIVGRELAEGGVEVVAGRLRFGDHPNGLSEVRIEISAARGDFGIEFVIAWEEYGPNPVHYVDESAPISLEKTYELALLRDQAGPGEPHASDRKTRRIGTESLGLMVETYTDDEAGRDPFGVARRAYARLRRRVDDDFTC